MIALIIMLLISLGIISYSMFRQTEIKSDKAKSWYEKFKRRLSNIGIHTFEYEGPKDLAERASKQRKDLAHTINEICQTYIDVRYKGKLEFSGLLEQKIKSFKPKKHAGQF